MWKYEQGTPCPALAQHTDIFSPPVFVDKPKPATTTAARSSTNVIDDVFDDYNDNTTRNISKLMRNEFKNARLGMPQKPRRNHAPAIGVFDDGNAAQQEPRRVGKEGSGNGDASTNALALKARRPQKIKLETVKEGRQANASLGVRKSAVYDASIMEDSFDTDEDPFQGEEATHVKPARDGRRRTIWMPSDDTSVLTIHPGAYDQTLRDDTIGLPAKRTLPAKIKPDVVQQRDTISRAPMSVAPKRAPLRALAPIQPNASTIDRVKCMKGKENLPPSILMSHSKSEKVFGKLDSKLLKTSIQPFDKPSPASRTSMLSHATAASQARAVGVKKRSAPESKDDVRKTKVAVTKDPRPRVSAENRASINVRDKRPAARVSLENKAGFRATSKSSAPTPQSRASANLSRYPVLADDLVQPELYEDNWLSHQEVVLTQLINSVFQQADSTSFLPKDDTASLRRRMLKSYQDPSVVSLHRKIKASLVYGALSMPKEGNDTPRLREDVGLRRQFLDLFVQSYSLDVLQAAAEVVVGRSMASRPRDAASIAQSLGSASSNSESAQEKGLRRFLLTFLVHHEDALDAKNQHGSGDQTPRVGSTKWYWQRTVLQTLMLIHLLDKTKTSGAVSGCLFQASSIRKSSNSILHALTRMLLPWIGDVTRPLGYLDYASVHSQQPLSEYTYHVRNLATDLRNGVLLTRFVELLVYPSSSVPSLPESTLTLSLPSGETLTSDLGTRVEESYPLSQHLKFPCAGRAQKLHNAQIALSALASANGALTSAAIASTSPDDIVDGHREKTLSLLWSLVSKWGLGLLVDWEELKHETRRFAKDEIAFDSRLYLDPDEVAAEDEMISPDAGEQAALLKAWAAAICSQRDVEVRNLTTSFSSGLALGCIVNAYAEFLPHTTSAKLQANKTSSGATLTAQALRALGCSTSFISLFTGSTTIPSRSTTLSLLAFLASRLLPLARTNRAAKTLQRAWRVFAAKRVVSQRVALMRLALDCKEVVRVKTEVLDRVVLLQRTWRRILAERKRVLDSDVGVFQTMARGWLVRKRAGKAGLLGGHGRGEGRRVMGGW